MKNFYVVASNAVRNLVKGCCGFSTFFTQNTPLRIASSGRKLPLVRKMAKNGDYSEVPDYQRNTKISDRNTLSK